MEKQNNYPLCEEKTQYEKPAIEIIEMEHEGSILVGSGDNFIPGRP